MFHRALSTCFNSVGRSIRCGSRLTASRWTSSSSPTDQHKLYLEQMQELQEERTTLFGTNTDIPAAPDIKSHTEKDGTEENSTSSPHSFTPEDKDRWTQQRELEFDFSQAEEQAWSSCGGSNHQHSLAHLQEIERARQQAQQQEQQSSLSDVPEQQPLSHVSPDGQSVHMVDVGSKQATMRTAIAETLVEFPPVVLQAFQRQGNELVSSKKGPIFSTAITAGIMAAKQTSALIPLCHPLPLSHVAVNCTWLTTNTVRVECTCRVTHTTGVEMEALTGASVAALTIYDMVKAVSHQVRIKDTRLLYKDGGMRRVDERE